MQWCLINMIHLLILAVVFCYGSSLQESQYSAIQRTRETRIIGCTVVHMGEAPFAASIYKTNDSETYFCAGAILSEQYILTAAQCVNDLESVTVQIGACSRKSGDDQRVIVESEITFIHFDFDEISLENDIALLWTGGFMEFNDYINPISLPTSPLDNNTAVTSIGWGYSNASDLQYANNLCRVDLTTISNDDCRSYYGSQVKDTMVCAEAEGSGTCTGDSGGPLIEYINDTAVHVGVNIFYSQEGCGVGPSGFTRTYDFLGWIRDIAGL